MKSKRLNIIFIIALLIFGFSLVRINLSNDVFFDLSVFKSVLQNGFYNIKNTTIHEGLKYNSIHWLYQVFIYFLNNKFGLISIYLFIAFGAMLYTMISYKCLKKMGTPKFLAMMLIILTLEVGFEFIQHRAQTFIMTVLILSIYSLEMLYKTNNKKYIFLIMFCFLIIANIQSYTFVISFAIFIPYFLEKLICLKKEDEKEGHKFIYSNKNLKNLIIAFIGCFLIGLINPYGITIYYEPFVVLNGYAKKYIQELQRPGFSDAISLYITVVPFLIMFVLKDVKVYIRDLLMILMYSIATLLIIKFGLYLIVASLIPLSREILYLLKHKNEKIYIALNEDNFHMVFIIVVLWIIFLTIFANLEVNLGKISLVPKDEYPVDACNWIKENLNYKDMRIYNYLADGSYLEYNGIDVFIDTRNEMFENNDESKSITKDFYELEYTHNLTYQELFEKYNIDYALIRKNSDIIVKYIIDDDNYNVVYEDEYYYVVVKN